MIDHKPWVGSEFKTGIGGKRIAIVGYSHHTDDPDYDDLTKDVIDTVISEEKRFSFFTQIRNYFGFESHKEFWNRVMFFNCLPDIVGDSDHRFGVGTLEQNSRIALRFEKYVFGENQPNLVFIFTSKGWDQLPKTREEKEGNQLKPISDEFPDVLQGTYRRDGGEIVHLFGFRHPQGAEGESMTGAVQHIMRKFAPS